MFGMIQLKQTLPILEKNTVESSIASSSSEENDQEKSFSHYSSKSPISPAVSDMAARGSNSKTKVEKNKNKSPRISSTNLLKPNEIQFFNRISEKSERSVSI